MNAAKVARTLIASSTLAVAGTSTATWDLRTCLGGVATVRVTNGGTGPTIAPTVTVNISTDGSTWRKLTAQQSDTGNSVVTDMVFDLPAAALYAQISITGNTGQSVTVESYGHELRGIG